MTLTMTGHTFRYEMENICRLFLPQEKVAVFEGEAPAAPASWPIQCGNGERRAPASPAACGWRGLMRS